MATSKKDKAQTGAQRASKSYRNKVDSGLRLIKVWVTDNPDNVEADRVRNYAAKLPETKSKLTASGYA